MRRLNFAPTARTIIVALVLIIVGLLGTYGTVVPDNVGIVAFLGATAILLFGMVFRLF
jgi:CBS-domain-containing membrane protein